MATRVERRRMIFHAGYRQEHPLDGSNLEEIQLSATTNGTTAVNVFGAKGAPFKGTITGVFVISQDTTAGNITPKIGSNTVCTIAKGTTAGVLVGATSLSNNTFNVGDSVTVVSSSAGNAQVFLSYTVSSTLLDVD